LINLPNALKVGTGMALGHLNRTGVLVVIFLVFLDLPAAQQPSGYKPLARADTAKLENHLKHVTAESPVQSGIILTAISELMSAYLTNHESKKVVERFTELIPLIAKHRTGDNRKSEAYLNIHATAAEALAIERKLDDAFEVGSEIYQLVKDNRELLKNRHINRVVLVFADIALRKGKIPIAVKSLEAASAYYQRLDPQDPQKAPYCHLKGRFFLAVHQPGRAKQQFLLEWYLLVKRQFGSADKVKFGNFEASSAFQATQVDPQLIKPLLGIARANSDLGQYWAGCSWAALAIDAINKNNGPLDPRICEAHMIAAETHTNLGYYRLAELHLSNVKNWFTITKAPKAIGDINDIETTQLNKALSLLAYRVGLLDEAARWARRSLKGVGKGSVEELHALLLLSKISLEKGDREDCLKLALASSDLADKSKLGGDFIRTKILHQMGGALRLKKDYPQAIKSIEDSLIGVKALSKANREWELSNPSKKPGYFFFEPYLLEYENRILLADIYFDQKEYEKCIENLNKANAISTRHYKNFDPSLLSKLNLKMAEANYLSSVGIKNIATKQKRLDAAIAGLLSAAYFSRRSLKSQMGIMDDSLIVQEAAKLYTLNDWLNVPVEAKFIGGEFNEIGARMAALSKGIIEEWKVINQRMSNRGGEDMSAIKTQQSKIILALNGKGLSENRKQQYLRELREISSRQAVIQTKASLALDKTFNSLELKMEDIAKQMPPGSCLVDFVLALDVPRIEDPTSKAESYYAYITLPSRGIFSGNKPIVKRVRLGPREQIDGKINALRKLIYARKIADRFLSPAIHDVSKAIYYPIAKHLKGAEHLFICPEGIVGRLPFELLMHEGKYLIETKKITYLGSAREIVRLSGKGDPADGELSAPVVIGNPDFGLRIAEGTHPKASRLEDTSLLGQNGVAEKESHLTRSYRGGAYISLPGTRDEALSVGGLLGKDVKILLGKSASESALKKIKRPEILHIASHAKYVPSEAKILPRSASAFSPQGLNFSLKWENPLKRCILPLAGANNFRREITSGDDGILSGLEAARLDLRGTKLVILSACETDLGDTIIGQGSMSLRRAFRIAGAKSVLASQWRVSDKATALLMTSFIKGWRSGKSKSDAWRAAQLSLLNSDNYKNPYFWASFTLMGDWH
jgi:CHAT domain-containing protein